jgi:hypothetical protein
LANHILLNEVQKRGHYVGKKREAAHGWGGAMCCMPEGAGCDSATGFLRHYYHW